MKFTKEDAYKDLVAKMTAKGEKLNLSERSINEQLDNLISLIANEETELSDFIEKVLPFIRTADANIRNDVSKGIKDYTDKNPYKDKQDPKSHDEPNDKNKESDLEARLAALEKRNQELELEGIIKSKRKELREYLKEKGVKKDEWIDLMLSEITIVKDTDISAKGDTLLGMYNKMYANVPDDDTTPRGSGGGSTKDTQLSESIKAAAEFAKSQKLI